MRIVPDGLRIKRLSAQRPVFYIGSSFGVPLVVYRIVRFFARREIIGIFIRDYSGGLCAEFKVLVLNDSGIGYLTFCIIDYCVALEILCFQLFMFKAQASVFQMSALVIEELVYASGEQDIVCQCVQFIAVAEIIGVETNLGSFQ